VGSGVIIRVQMDCISACGASRACDGNIDKDMKDMTRG
jgi:hypothetical protein